MWVRWKLEIWQIQFGSGTYVIIILFAKSWKDKIEIPGTSSRESSGVRVFLAKELELPNFVHCEH